MSFSAKFRPSDNHWRHALGVYRERITREQLKHHLLNNPDPIYEGELCIWKHKHLGVGVYELWIEEKKVRSEK